MIKIRRNFFFFFEIVLVYIIPVQLYESMLKLNTKGQMHNISCTLAQHISNVRRHLKMHFNYKNNWHSFTNTPPTISENFITETRIQNIPRFSLVTVSYSKLLLIQVNECLCTNLINQLTFFTFLIFSEVFYNFTLDKSKNSRRFCGISRHNSNDIS